MSKDIRVQQKKRVHISKPKRTSSQKTFGSKRRSVTQGKRERSASAPAKQNKETLLSGKRMSQREIGSENVVKKQLHSTGEEMTGEALKKRLDSVKVNIFRFSNNNSDLFGNRNFSLSLRISKYRKKGFLSEEQIKCYNSNIKSTIKLQKDFRSSIQESLKLLTKEGVFIRKEGKLLVDSPILNDMMNKLSKLENYEDFLKEMDSLTVMMKEFHKSVTTDPETLKENLGSALALIDKAKKDLLSLKGLDKDQLSEIKELLKEAVKTETKKIKGVKAKEIALNVLIGIGVVLLAILAVVAVVLVLAIFVLVAIGGGEASFGGGFGGACLSMHAVDGLAHGAASLASSESTPEQKNIGKGGLFLKLAKKHKAWINDLEKQVDSITEMIKKLEVLEDEKGPLEQQVAVGHKKKMPKSQE